MSDPSSQSITLPSLTEDIATKAILDFFRDKPFVIFGTGMSCALDPRFGMSSLKSALRQGISPSLQAIEQQRQWAKVLKSLQNGNGLETALNNVIDETLLQKITCATGRFIASVDRECALQIAGGKSTWPATALFKRLVDTLPEGDPVLHVLTPNYDTLFEHACDVAGISYTCGFFGEIICRLDWGAVKRSLLYPQESPRGRKLTSTHKYHKHARLYKVHGSLNYFHHRNSVIQNNAWMWDAPDFANRVMITPGLWKYRLLQDYRKELLKSADAAIERANRFLFLGYGFNDAHLETYIKQKLVTQSCKGLILTKDSNSRIEFLLGKAKNLWLICKTQDENTEGTRIFNSQYSGWLELPTKKLWDIRTFTAEVLGV